VLPFVEASLRCKFFQQDRSLFDLMAPQTSPSSSRAAPIKTGTNHHHTSEASRGRCWRIRCAALRSGTRDDLPAPPRLPLLRRRLRCPCQIGQIELADGGSSACSVANGARPSMSSSSWSSRSDSGKKKVASTSPPCSGFGFSGSASAAAT
jgi:hypothetical protein